jgi:DNA-binding NarL/FixJ family response regulator
MIDVRMHAQWSEAYASLADADAADSLDAADLEQLAIAAYMTGRDDACREALTRAHQRWTAQGEVDPAVRCAFWIGLNLMLRGQVAPALGWFGRGAKLVAELPGESIGAGYLAVAAALQALIAGDAERALQAAELATRSGRRAGEVDLSTLGCLGRGQALVAVGRSAEGVAALDEAMVAVTAGEASPIVIGIVYCAVIEACQELFDVRRAHEWTDALGEWCDRQSGLVPYRGQCLVHRAELLRSHGSWGEALREAEQAAAWLTEPPHPAAGAAFYQQAELHRLRGDVEAAERDYRRASESGHGVQPGLALLRLIQGRVDDAATAVRRALVEPQLPSARVRLLAAQVEIALAAGDVAAARGGADELAVLTTGLGAPPLLEAMSGGAEGAVLLAEGDAPAALRALRQAWTVWHELDAPYDAALMRLQIALACRALGDEESALLELEAAGRVFNELGAAPDAARAEGLAVGRPAGTLTRRELEVLGLVATGATNRTIASQLVISEKTVARHLSNIFVKLGVASRAAATAYAYEHDLVSGRRHR